MSERYQRQSFLGPDAQSAIENTVVGVVGLGGGGSHIVQQLAHIGFKNYVLYDEDVVTETNLNRLIGARSIDVAASTPKLYLAKMMILGLQPDAVISGFPCRWQEAPDALRRCHIIFGCVETFLGRLELEQQSRRYLAHYIDIGMDVHGGPTIGGQVILSSPGGPCMKCIGFITDENITKEAMKYGDVGGRPQVVWPNGVLASTAVGVAVDLVTGWTKIPKEYFYKVYDGRQNVLEEPVANEIPNSCKHYAAQQIGDPVLQKL
jgi:molybdopterin-synthase adenylyltransferase